MQQRLSLGDGIDRVGLAQKDIKGIENLFPNLSDTDRAAL